MPRGKLKLKVLESAPCTQPWNAMQGNGRERLCVACEKQVYNFAAMTAKQIENLVREREGRLCARVTYRPDGSICTADGLSQPSVAASVALAASLAFGASAAAESRTDAPAEGKATLTGTVLSPDGSAPLAGAAVSLRAGDQTLAITQTDAHGNFLITVKPGEYEISIGDHQLFGAHIYAADLHEGDQSLQPVRVSLKNEPRIGALAGLTGVVVIDYRYPISFLFKHPLRYLKHLLHQL